MPYRPCLHPGCRNVTASSYCRAHRRDPNLARQLLLAIYERDLEICQLCGAWAPSPGTPGPDGPTLDHIAGLAAGDDPSNLRLAHRRCNSARG